MEDRTQGSPNPALSVSKDVISLSFNRSKVCDRFFRSFLFKGAASRAKVGTQRQDTLHNPRRDWGIVPVVGCSSEGVAKIVRADTTSRPG